jgi:hypothetical protein
VGLRAGCPADCSIWPSRCAGLIRLGGTIRSSSGWTRARSPKNCDGWRRPRGTNLTAAERALFTRRRKEAYEALHPETRAGGDRRSSDCQLGDLKSERFTADTAIKTGQSERAVQRDAARGKNVAPEVMAPAVSPPRYMRPPPPPIEGFGAGGPNNSTWGPLPYRLVTTPPFGQPFGPQLVGTTDVAVIEGGQAFDCGVPVGAAQPPHSASEKSDGSRRFGISSPPKLRYRQDAARTFLFPLTTPCRCDGDCGGA